MDRDNVIVEKAYILTLAQGEFRPAIPPLPVYGLYARSKETAVRKRQIILSEDQPDAAMEPGVR